MKNISEDRYYNNPRLIYTLGVDWGGPPVTFNTFVTVPENDQVSILEIPIVKDGEIKGSSFYIVPTNNKQKLKKENRYIL